MNRKRRSRMLKVLAAALGLSIAGCALAGPPYPNVVPIDKTGNFGAR
jgi:predicted small lipoprotein YifL